MAGVAVLAACSDGDVESDRVFVLTAVNGLMPALVANSPNPTWPFVVVVADTLTLRPDGTWVETTITTLASENGQEGTLFRGVVLGTRETEFVEAARAIGESHLSIMVRYILPSTVAPLIVQSSLRMATVLSPLLDGEVDRAAAMMAELGEPEGETAQMGARLTWLTAQAELALARGHHAEAIRRYDDLVAMVVESDPAAGINPWLMLAASAALVARARHGDLHDDVRAAELRDLLLGSADGAAESRLWFADLPLNGVMLVALGLWALRFGPAEQHEDAVRLLAVAHRWAYNRSIPVLAWEPMVTLADAPLPGRVDQLVEELADRPGPELVAGTAEVVDRLRRRWLTSP